MSTRSRTRLPAGRWEYPGPGSTSTKTARCHPRAARRAGAGRRGPPAVQRRTGARTDRRGSPPTCARPGWKVSKNTVAAVMREQGLAARRKKKRRSTTRPGKGRWRAAGPGQAGLPRTPAQHASGTATGPRSAPGEGKLYLASVMDMASRRVLGFALGEHHDAQLAYSALVMAVAVRGGQVPGVIMHTDRGSEYTAGLVRQACAAAVDLPVDGPARVRAGQRGHRVLALHPGIRAPLARALHDQGSGPGPGQRLDPGLQHRTGGTPRWA